MMEDQRIEYLLQFYSLLQRESSVYVENHVLPAVRQELVKSLGVTGEVIK